MAQTVTKTSSRRLLLNAEPFGFGPTAAIAGFFPHLRPHFKTIGYVGKKHTLDLQRHLPYNRIHDVTGTLREEREDALQPIFQDYDILFTAMDYKVADEAKKAGLKVFYYDALTWYWPEIPQSALNSDLYLAQNFFGVTERLSTVFNHHASAHVVPAFIPGRQPALRKSHILINLGGLQNPYWPLDDVIDYARAVIAALRKAIPSSETVLIAGSEAVSARLADQGVKTYPRAAMKTVLAQSKLAFMTPGLGNIYDAAAYDVRTIWLPPANDSQGQQMSLLEHHGMCDASIDWLSIMPGTVIDYAGPQQDVLRDIAEAATHLSCNPWAGQELTRLAASYYQKVAEQPATRTNKLVQRFGRGGEQVAAKLVIKKALSYD